MQVLEGCQIDKVIAADHLLSRANDTLQSALVLDSVSSVPDGDGGCGDGRVKVTNTRDEPNGGGVVQKLQALSLSEPICACSHLFNYFICNCVTY